MALTLALPAGHMLKGIQLLLSEASIGFSAPERTIKLEADWLFPISAKVLKPRDIVRFLESGSRQAAFIGTDLIAESGTQAARTVLDLGLDPVRIVLAGPAEAGHELTAALHKQELPKAGFRVATEYPNLTKAWFAERFGDCSALTIIPVSGSTEAYPPDDADLIVDNAASGRTLRENNLFEFAQLNQSSTWLVASAHVLPGSETAEQIDRLATFLAAALEARRHVLIKANVPESAMESLCADIPARRAPTITKLGRQGFDAIEVAVSKEHELRVLDLLKRADADSILVLKPNLLFP